ncbi:MAG TPA: flagellar export protein FliJ [Syntrophobacteraceae bacterium]|nr:flagellar export protein FliJ [Syntrophobacteraceae bacterium]
MPFKFRLKSLKRHREFVLREAQAALGAAVSARMRIVAEIQQLAQTIRNQSDQLEQEQKNGIQAPRYLYFKDHLSSLEHELLVLFKQLERASREVENRRYAMIEKDKSVKTMESIETRDKELYKLTQARKEQRKLDDVALMKTASSR